MKITNRMIAVVVVAATLSIPVASYFFSSSHEDEQSACEKRCTPKLGVMKRDPVFDNAFKKSWDGGPMVCQCMETPR
jgi:hypothetical protein